MGRSETRKEWSPNLQNCYLQCPNDPTAQAQAAQNAGTRQAVCARVTTTSTPPPATTTSSTSTPPAAQSATTTQSTSEATPGSSNTKNSAGSIVVGKLMLALPVIVALFG
ncbi:5228_t:CDS:2 [Paraglomus occultum]|uniref:5228_t:CDS:1 n=1 Tax=Paraglomus occultum TaxID=144539 RepID=A0A9N8ZGJ6_9GLOM|nr:5228_t:CDS:2 [Paraglomus occultum]